MTVTDVSLLSLGSPHSISELAILTIMQMMTMMIRGAIKKTVFFFTFGQKGGVSPNPKGFYQKN